MQVKRKYGWSWGWALLGLVVGLCLGVLPALVLVPLLGLSVEVVE